MPPVSERKLQRIMLEVSARFGQCLKVEMDDDAWDHLPSVFDRTVKKGVMKDDGDEWWEGTLPSGANGRKYALHAACELAQHLNPQVLSGGAATKEQLEKALEEVDDNMRKAMKRKYSDKELEVMVPICPG